MGRAIVAVTEGVVSAFVTILLVEVLGTLVAPAGVAPDVKDVGRMRADLLTLPLSAYAFLLLAYLVGSVVGGWSQDALPGRRGRGACGSLGVSC